MRGIVANHMGPLIALEEKKEQIIDWVANLIANRDGGVLPTVITY